MQKTGKAYDSFIIFMCALILTFFSSAQTKATTTTDNHYFDSVQKKLINDGFDSEKIKSLYSRPQVSFEADGVTVYFTYSEAKVDYAQFAITTPYPGTEMYAHYCKSGGETRWEDIVFRDGVNTPLAPVFENRTINRESLLKWESRAIKQFYLSPSYMWRRFKRIRSIRDILVNLNSRRQN